MKWVYIWIVGFRQKREVILTLIWTIKQIIVVYRHLKNSGGSMRSTTWATKPLKDFRTEWLHKNNIGRIIIITEKWKAVLLCQ